MSEEIQRQIKMLRSWGFEAEKVADTLEKLLAVYEASGEFIQEFVPEVVAEYGAQHEWNAMCDAYFAVTERQPNSPLTAAGEDNQESSKSGAVGASTVSGRETCRRRAG